MSNVSMSSLLSGQGTSNYFGTANDFGCSTFTLASSTPEPKMNKRLVNVYIIDPHPAVPSESSVLYQTDKPILTDLTDEELFLDIDIKGRLEKHNAARVEFEEETEEGSKKLKPAKLRDIRKFVHHLASF